MRVTAMYQPLLPLVNLPAFPVSSIASHTIIKGVDGLGTPLPSPTQRFSYTATSNLTATTAVLQTRTAATATAPAQTAILQTTVAFVSPAPTSFQRLHLEFQLPVKSEPGILVTFNNGCVVATVK
ncbi:MAG TPA: hypothetical protein VLH85_09505 [Levilinea sp.]|nr:hypothetical protein [Levilinea sp.]